MKRIGIMLAGCLILFLLCACSREESDNVNSKTSVVNGTVTIRNGVTDADVWLLPDTQANRKTTLWGTATAADVKTGESRPVSLPEPGDDGQYLLRLIDTGHFYYSADALELHDGWRIEIREVDVMTVTAAVTDEDGDVQCVYDVFSAHL